MLSRKSSKEAFETARSFREMSCSLFMDVFMVMGDGDVDYGVCVFFEMLSLCEGGVNVFESLKKEIMKKKDEFVSRFFRSSSLSKFMMDL